MNEENSKSVMDDESWEVAAAIAKNLITRDPNDSFGRLLQILCDGAKKLRSDLAEVRQQLEDIKVEHNAFDLANSMLLDENRGLREKLQELGSSCPT